MEFRKIFTDSVVSTLRTLLLAGRRLIVIPLVTKLIDIGSYGFWAATIGLVFLFSKIGSLQMQGSLIRFTSMEDDQAKTFGGTLVLTLVGATIAGAGFAIFAVTTGFFDQLSFSPQQQRWLLAIASAMVVFRTLFSYLSTYPRAQNRVKEFEAIQVLELATELVAVGVTLYLTRSIVWGLLALATVLAIANVVLAVRYVGTGIEVPDTSRLLGYLRYSFPLIFKGVSALLLTNADKLIILYLLSPAAAGVYAAAYSVCGVFRSLSSVLNPTLYPAVSTAWDADEMDELRTLYRYILTGYTILAVPALIGLTLVAPSLVRLLATEAVGEGVALLVPVIGIGLLFRAYEGPLSFILKAAERTQVLGAAVVVAAVMNVALNLLLISSIGLFGAAVATLFSEVFIFASVLWYARSLVEITVPGRMILKTCLASTVMGATLFMLPIPMTSVVFLAVSPPLGIIIYFAILYSVGGIPDAALNRARLAVQ